MLRSVDSSDRYNQFSSTSPNVKNDNNAPNASSVEGNRRAILMLIDEARLCITKNYLGMIQHLGIEAIQRGYEEIAEEIYRLQNEHHLDDSLLITLFGKLSSLENHKLDSLFNTAPLVGFSDLCELYHRLRGLYEKELLILREKMVPFPKVPQDSPRIHPQFYLQPVSARPGPKKEEAAFWANKEFVLVAVKQNGLALQDADRELQNDREVIFTAVRQNGLALQHASEKDRNDRDILRAAVEQNGLALQHASEQLKGDKEILRAAVRQNGLALQYGSEKDRNDRDIVRAAVEQNGLALQHASEQLKGDKEILRAAVRQNGLALQYGNEEHKGSREIVLAALTQTGLALRYASKQFKRDGEFVLGALTQNGLALQYAPEELKRDREIVLAALTQNGLALQYAPEELKRDREIVLAALTQNGLALQYAPEELKRDREIVLAALTQNGLALQYAPEELKRDREILLAALKQNSFAFEQTSEELRNKRQYVELIYSCLRETSTSERSAEFFIPLIRLIATYFIEEPIEAHLVLFNMLSKSSETLREAYLEVLETNYADRDKLEHLRAMINQSGDRFSFIKRQAGLKTQLEAITTDNLSDLKFDAKAQWIPRVIFRTSRGILYLKPEIAREIIDRESGDLKKGYTGSLHPVTSFAGLHFKQKPTNPLIEYAIHSLLFRLSGGLAPPSELVRFEVNGKKLYPVQISTTVPGVTLKKRLETPLTLEKPEQWARWTWMLLCSVLTRPGDGRLSNYIVDPQDNIYCIDNDISFVEPAVQGVVSQVNFCSALFCLFQDRPLDQSVLAKFCSLNANAILLNWIDDVIEKEEEYSKLFNEEERRVLYDEDPNNRFRVKALFKKGTLATLITQFIYLQNQLNALLKKNEIPKPPELLKYIITLTESPHLMNISGMKVYKRYLEANHPLVEDRLQWILSRPQDTSMRSIQTDQICLGRNPAFEEVERSEEFSSKKAKEELLTTVRRGSPFFQANFKEMCDGNGPDLERQRHALLALGSCLKCKPPTSLIIQHCDVLNTKFLEHFLHQDLEYLDLSYCPNIKSSDVETIQKKCPKLKELCVSGCSGLTAIESWKVIGSEYLSFSNLRVLHAECCPNLKRVNVKCPGLQLVNLNKNSHINYLRLASFFQIERTSEDCPKLEEAIAVVLDLKDLETSGRELFNDKDFMLVAVQQNGLLLKYASAEIRDDREIVLAAVRQNWQALHYASNDRHTDDREIVLALVRQTGIALEFASERLRKDREVVLAAVQQNWQALEYASKEFGNDREIMLIALQQNSWAFKYLSLELKDDRDIVLASVQNNGMVLGMANARMTNDRDIVLAAVRQNGSAIMCASNKLSIDKKVILAAVTQNGLALNLANSEFRDDLEIVQAAVAQNRSAVKYASERIKKLYINEIRRSTQNAL